MLWLVLECFQIIEVKPYFRQLHPAAVRNVAKFSNLGGCRFVSWFRRQVGIFAKKEIPVIISGSSMFNSGNGRIENTSHLVIHHLTTVTIFRSWMKLYSKYYLLMKGRTVFVPNWKTLILPSFLIFTLFQTSND